MSQGCQHLHYFHVLLLLMRHTTRNAAPLTPSFSITPAGSYANVGRASMASRTLTSCLLCASTLSLHLAPSRAARMRRNARTRRHASGRCCIDEKWCYSIGSLPWPLEPVPEAAAVARLAPLALLAPGLASDAPAPPQPQTAAS